jgi:hypothetical protein
MYKLSIVYTTTNLPQFLFSEGDREGDWIGNLRKPPK